MIMRALAGLLVGSLTCIVAPSSARAADLAVDWVNNQPFDIRMPVRLRGVKMQDAANAQQAGDDLIVIADVPANQTKTTTIYAQANQKQSADLQIEPAEGAIGLGFKGKSLGSLSWDVMVTAAAKETAEPVSSKRNFDESFKPLPLKFE